MECDIVSYILEKRIISSSELFNYAAFFNEWSVYYCEYTKMIRFKFRFNNYAISHFI